MMAATSYGIVYNKFVIKLHSILSHHFILSKINWALITQLYSFLRSQSVSQDRNARPRLLNEIINMQIRRYNRQKGCYFGVNFIGTNRRRDVTGRRRQFASRRFAKYLSRCENVEAPSMGGREVARFASGGPSVYDNRRLRFDTSRF